MMTGNSQVPACNLIIFGTKGDLARRKLLPSLYQLEKLELLHPDTRIIGVGRADWDNEAYITVVKEALERFSSEKIDKAVWQRMSKRLSFFELDVNDKERFKELAVSLDLGNRFAISYLAMHSSTFESVFRGLGFAGLNQPPHRVVMEKPLGMDLASSIEINELVDKYFNESQIYRIDHYLGKETVLNLLALRFANSFFAMRWDNSIIDNVQITVAEEVGIEGRWGYFDHVGQLRDMVQSHLLQILAILAMDAPSTLDTENIRQEKVKVLRALRPIRVQTVKNKIVRGQYTSGEIKNEKVPGYLEEEGANKDSNTETYVCIRANIDNWRWAGVPFYLRTGKRLSAKSSEVVIYFKNPPLNLFYDSYHQLSPNKLTIRLQPDEGIALEILNKVPGLNEQMELQPSKLDLNFSSTFKDKRIADAYERLLLEIMRGNQTLFVHRDEVEEAWKWIDSIMSAWAAVNEPVRPYPAGSSGPIEADNMLTYDGYKWHEID